jgi:hypothetical protein
MRLAANSAWVKGVDCSSSLTLTSAHPEAGVIVVSDAAWKPQRVGAGHVGVAEAAERDEPAAATRRALRAASGAARLWGSRKTSKLVVASESE